VILPQPEQRPVDEILRTIDLYNRPDWRDRTSTGSLYVEGLTAMLRWGAGLDPVAPITRRELGQRPTPLEASTEQYAAYEGMSTGRYGGHPLPDPDVMGLRWLTGAENAGGWLAGDDMSIVSASENDKWERERRAESA
jgi:hypothetical protein